MAGGDNIWIIANWKSNKTIREALDWIGKVGPAIPKKENLKVVVCPTFSAISEVTKEIMVGDSPMLIGTQDLSPFGIGPYTGEEPAALVKDYVNLSILGHSERRQNFNETDEMVAKKVEQAKAFSITPLVCVQGEETPIPQGCTLTAYEPIFAIGTGNPDTPQNANEVAKKLRQKYGPQLQVLYGGSVDSSNVKGFIRQDDISGVLVGNAALDAAEFIKIIKVCEE